MQMDIENFYVAGMFYILIVMVAPQCTHQCVCMFSRFSRVRLFATPWTIAYRAPPSMGFSRQKYWSG